MTQNYNHGTIGKDTMAESGYGFCRILVIVFFNIRFNLHCNLFQTSYAQHNFSVFKHNISFVIAKTGTFLPKKYIFISSIKCFKFYCPSCGEFSKWHMSAQKIIVLQLPFYLFRVKENGLFRTTTHKTTLHPKTILKHVFF